MKILQFLMIVLLAIFGTSTASAALLNRRPDVSAALAQPDINVGDIELAKDELVAFYAARDNRPAWSFAGPDNATTFAGFLASLQQVVDYHGLPVEDYPFDLMKTLAASGSDDDMKLELLVTDTLLHLAHALHGDVVDLDNMYPGWNFRRAGMDIPNLLAAAVSNNELDTFMTGLTPKNPAYTKLADALKTYRGIASQGGWQPIAPGPKLQFKDRGPRVGQLRARLAAENYLPPMPTPVKKYIPVFDEDLRKAIVAYQTRNGLGNDGTVGEKTLAALNVPVSVRLDQIRANMERWRHMPDDFPGSRYTLVNIPDASIDIVEDSHPVYHGIVIVGRVDRKTPFIQSAIRSMIFNPSWHVPSKIAREDILPKLKKDPHYLEKLGFVIKDSEDDPHGENIDWKSMPEREFDFRLRQSPGDMNSLGRLKFDFDNNFAVYMHGTPHQELFKKNVRDLSSGCVRLRDPEQVAQIVLAGNKDPWPLDRIESEIASNKTHWVAIAKPLPIYILYWTVFTGDDGALNFRDDIYDYDSFLIQNMNPEPKAETPTPALSTTPKIP